MSVTFYSYVRVDMSGLRARNFLPVCSCLQVGRCVGVRFPFGVACVLAWVRFMCVVCVLTQDSCFGSRCVCLHVGVYVGEGACVEPLVDDSDFVLAQGPRRRFEVRILSSLAHPNVLRVHEVMFSKDQKRVRACAVLAGGVFVVVAVVLRAVWG